MLAKGVDQGEMSCFTSGSRTVPHPLPGTPADSTRPSGFPANGRRVRVPARLALGTVLPMTGIRLAHLSDTHIGYEAYKTLSAAGENQRGVDIARAFVNVCDDIVAADPSIVIHSGDVADRTVIPIRLMLLIRREIAKLASVRPDGTRRQVVIVAGNHELPRNRKEACFLELLRGLPGVHVITTSYQQVTFDGLGTSEGCDKSLNDLVVHALPHDVLKSVDFDIVRPVPGKMNIISSHGVAGGSELYVRSLGREFAIPTDVLARNWEYGALGHWHKQGPVPIVATGGRSRRSIKSADAVLTSTLPVAPLDPLSSATCCNDSGSDVVDTTGESGRIWYAGSTENCGFGDLKDNGARRGWLHVTINAGQDPLVQRRHLPIRAMFRLPVLDAAGMTPEEITDALIARVKSVEISGSVIGQIVDGVSRDVWSLVDLVRVRATAATALHYEVATRNTATKRADGRVEHRGLAEASQVLSEQADASLTDVSLRAEVLAFASDLLNRRLEQFDRERDAGRVAASAASSSDDDQSFADMEEVSA